jgi:hypothetical protein
VDLDAVAHELYGLRPAEFTAVRNARAVGVRRAGDPELATAIKKLRRPSTGAWIANLLARRRGEHVDQLLEVGAAMRTAQRELATDDLRRLSRTRRELITTLVDEGRDLVDEIGQPVTDASWRELEATLEAALADPDAGEAVRAGCLTTAISYSGLGPIDLSGAVATPPRTRTGRSSDTRDRQGKRAPERKGQPKGQQRSEAAARAFRDAQAVAAGVAKDVETQRRRTREARRQEEQSHQETIDAQRHLQRLQATEKRAAGAVAQAEQSLARAEAKLGDATKRVERERAKRH